MGTLENFYDGRVERFGKRDFLTQVGHTEGGQPISPAQFQIMVGQICSLLAPGPHDRLLDLACGNGLVTAELSRNVQTTIGVDLSGRLVELAQRYQSGPNLRYFHHDVRQLDTLAGLQGESFSKIVMHAALQHFHPSDLEPLLRAMLSVATEDVVIVLGFVPRDGRQRFFYRTVRRRISGALCRAFGRDYFGTWWRDEQINDVCARLGLTCSFHDINPGLDAARYRCNIRITRANALW